VGNAMVLVAVGSALLLIGGIRLADFLPPILVVGMAVGLFIYHNPMRSERIYSWLHLEETRRDKGLQAYQAMLALGSGGVTGKGLGDGRQKLGFVPEHHTDFIFSIIGEELGLIATMLVLAGFGVGVGLAATMDRFIPHRHARGHHQHLGHEPGHDHHDRADRPADARRGYAILGALTIHRIPEGLAIGAGFAAGAGPHARLGLLLAIAVGVQNACEGIVMAAPLRKGGVAAARGLAIITVTGLTTPVAALVGAVASGRTAPTMPFILALAAGTLIYVTSNEIIPESHSHGFEGTASGGVVAGFLATILLQAILP